MQLGRPMLAMRDPPEEIEYPLLGSFKLDGFRALVGGDFKLYTRKLKLVRNYHTQDLFGRKALLGFDGELAVGPPKGKGVFQRTSSGVTSYEGEPDVRFYVFDLWNRPGVEFRRRFRELCYRVQDLGDERVEVVEHVTIRDAQALEEYEAEAISRQYEGLILRDPSGAYLNTRCGVTRPWMWKLKRFQDDEMVVTGVEEEMENLNPKVKNELGLSKRSSHKANKRGKGRVGALLGYDRKTRQDVRVGSGMTAKEREDLWDLWHKKKLQGAIVTYKHFAQSGVKDKRRHTIYKGIRHRDDL